jgi:hypothetical protein
MSSIVTLVSLTIFMYVCVCVCVCENEVVVVAMYQRRELIYLSFLSSHFMVEFVFGFIRSLS